MTTEKYFQKNGFVYGVSSKHQFGWEHYVIRFDNLEEAMRWLDTEEYDFRVRELCSKSGAIKIAGRNKVEAARPFDWALV